MAGKTNRAQLELSFVNAGLYRLCKKEPGDSMSDDQTAVYRSLVRASRKIAARDLGILVSAFDGISNSGASLREE